MSYDISMMEPVTRERVYYNADDEEPACSRCERITSDFDCENLCGAEHGWNGYLRMEIVEMADESEV